MLTWSHTRRIYRAIQGKALLKMYSYLSLQQRSLQLDVVHHVQDLFREMLLAQATVTL